MENTTELVMMKKTIFTIKKDGDLFTDIHILGEKIRSIKVIHEQECQWECTYPEEHINRVGVNPPIWINMQGSNHWLDCTIEVLSIGPVEICGEYVMIKDIIFRRLINHKKVVIELEY